jgi:hypothetical protein
MYVFRWRKTAEATTNVLTLTYLQSKWRTRINTNAHLTASVSPQKPKSLSSVQHFGLNSFLPFDGAVMKWPVVATVVQGAPRGGSQWEVPLCYTSFRATFKYSFHLLLVPLFHLINCIELNQYRQTSEFWYRIETNHSSTDADNTRLQS